ncbi:MAG: precorrin-2 C(20)-methyltransferase [Methylomonas sp.]|nr:precorrin-2 C(20)-methyltransferase [Methylomonas sp.]PPD19395.1 MAG: precorrin-2 C(20)-methyltransferase [Methylomonas sp.]PPD24334.1 MAG: precorrin-2 C(20)-methyltransferase [Methylomonas sp.]PPD32886.1 MAG: precorrin-2 C(20)-methyltransferase [Methylomonas sp.]PPD54044.1 MAG: precorrin-2 C(20)-methyltransferase [Methylomonas sp.]
MNIKLGTLYGVSLGPGDPGLMTQKTWQLLSGPGHWTYPVRKKGGDSYALDIALRADFALPAAHTPLHFPMTHDAGILARYWLEAAQTVLTLLKKGEDVLFLVEGDASTYSTFGHLQRSVRALQADVAIEVVPGVSSFHAAAARCREPLADTDDTIAIIPAGYGVGSIEHMLNDFDTLVLLKVKPMLDDIIDLLERRGLLDHARFVEKAGAPEERTVEDVGSLKGQKVNYLSLIIVKNPGRQRSELQHGCRKKNRR